MSDMSPSPMILFARMRTTVSKGMLTAPMNTDRTVTSISTMNSTMQSPAVESFPSSMLTSPG